jgi:hypothetical protein
LALQVEVDQEKARALGELPQRGALDGGGDHGVPLGLYARTTG